MSATIQTRRQFTDCTPCSQPRTAAKLEDIEFLTRTGCGRDETAQRTGYRSPTSMERFLYRHGRQDLIRKMLVNEELYLSGRYRAVTR